MEWKRDFLSTCTRTVCRTLIRMIYFQFGRIISAKRSNSELRAILPLYEDERKIYIRDD